MEEHGGGTDGATGQRTLAVTLILAMAAVGATGTVAADPWPIIDEIEEYVHCRPEPQTRDRSVGAGYDCRAGDCSDSPFCGGSGCQEEWDLPDRLGPLFGGIVTTEARVEICWWHNPDGCDMRARSDVWGWGPGMEYSYSVRASSSSGTLYDTGGTFNGPGNGVEGAYISVDRGGWVSAGASIGNEDDPTGTDGAAAGLKRTC